MRVGIFSFLFILASFICIEIPAQDCHCPEYNKLKTQQQASGDNYRIYIEKLRGVNTIICKAKAEEWIANEYKSENNFDTAEIYFYNAEKLYQQSGCGDSIFLSVYKSWAQTLSCHGRVCKSPGESLKIPVKCRECQ